MGVFFVFFKLTKCGLFSFMCSDLTTSSFLFYSLIGRKLLPNLGVPEFEVARNVFELIYAQTLVWYGLRLFPARPNRSPNCHSLIFYRLPPQDRDLLLASAAGYPDSQMLYLLLCEEGKSTAVPFSASLN